MKGRLHLTESLWKRHVHFEILENRDTSLDLFGSWLEYCFRKMLVLTQLQFFCSIIAVSFSLLKCQHNAVGPQDWTIGSTPSWQEEAVSFNARLILVSNIQIMALSTGTNFFPTHTIYSFALWSREDAHCIIGVEEGIIFSTSLLLAVQSNTAILLKQFQIVTEKACFQSQKLK